MFHIATQPSYARRGTAGLGRLSWMEALQGGAFSSARVPCHFFLRLGLRRKLPQVAPKRLKLILPPYDTRIARATRAVKFSGACLQNCDLVNLRRDRTNPLSTVGNGPSAGENAPPWYALRAHWARHARTRVKHTATPLQHLIE